MEGRTHDDTDLALATDALEPLCRLAKFDGLLALTSDELLALVLGPGGGGAPALGEARRLLDGVGGLDGLARRGLRGLCRELGFGERRALRLLAALELGRRIEERKRAPVEGARLTAGRVAEWALPRLSGLEHEEVWVLCVDGQSRLRSAWQVGRGGIHGCALLPRDVLTPVVREAASGFVLVHNHPSGDPTPSREDKELTHHLDRASALLCSPLLDHVVVARSGYRSFFEDGILHR